MGSSAVCVEWMSTGRACQSGSSPPILPHLQRHHGCAARSSVFGYEFPRDQPLFSSLLSLAFGGLIISGTPPLRGPDEISHFVRIYSYARGEILPTTEVNGRKGILVEPRLYSELQFFRTAGEVFAREDGLHYPQLVAGYRNPTSSSIADEPDEAPIFAPFAGTEGYNPVAYIPYIAAAAIGRLFKLDFPDMLLFMRWFGLATFTAIAAYSIAVTPALKWAFVLIALLPVSLYNRSVLSADGAALSTALTVTALCLRAAGGTTAGRVWERSLWMTLCALSKQPQIVFLLLELMVYRVKELPRQWLRIASVVLPSVILSPHVGVPSLGRDGSLAAPRGRIPSA